MNLALTLENLHKRKPQIYDSAMCILCAEGEVETLEHITICPALEADWKRIEALTGETAWNSLTSDAKYKVDSRSITKAIFDSRTEDIGITRLNLTKGLIKQSVVNNLNELLSSHKDARNTALEILQGFWNHFYEDIWKRRCEQIVSWEKRKGITKQFKWSAHHGSPSTSTKKKQLHKIDVGPRDGPGLGSSKVSINMGIQQGRRNEDSTPVLKHATIVAIEDFIKTGRKPYWYGS